MAHRVGLGANSYRVIQTDTTESALTRWTWTPEMSGEQPVYMWYVAGENRSPSTLLRIGSGEHFETVRVNQTERGSRWVYLGTFPFQANQEAWVEISNLGSDTTRYVVADALWVGGGTGTVDFGGGTSGQTFWEQSAQVQSREFSLPSEISEPIWRCDGSPSLGTLGRCRPLRLASYQCGGRSRHFDLCLFKSGCLSKF